MEGGSQKNILEKQRHKQSYSNTLEDMSELVFQYGYVTLFVVALPCAPLLALGSNIVEMRIDGSKLVNHCQRPLPLGATGLGMWTHVIALFSKMAIVSNAWLYTYRTSKVDEYFGSKDEEGVYQ